MATIAELRSYLLVSTGNLFDNEIDDSMLQQVVNKSLIYYNNYTPAVKESIVGIWGAGLFSTGGQVYQFPAPYPKACSAYPLFVGINFFDGLATSQSTYDSKSGELKVNAPGYYRIKYYYDLTLDDINQTDHPLFYLVLEANYKMSLGGMRKRFQLSDTQFTTDTSLYDEGKAQLEEVTKMLMDNSPVWIALGGR